MSEEKGSVLDRVVGAVKDITEAITNTNPDDKDTDGETQAVVDTSHPMHSLVESSPVPPHEGDIIEGTVSAIGRARVYVELAPFGTGLIYGREFMNARDILRKVSVGDTIAAKVVDPGTKTATSSSHSRKLARHSSGVRRSKHRRSRPSCISP